MPSELFDDEDPGLDGPDYVALVIEWPDEAAAQVGEVIDEVTRPTAMTRVRALARTLASHKTAALIGAAIAVGLTAWGVHRHRAAC